MLRVGHVHIHIGKTQFSISSFRGKLRHLCKISNHLSFDSVLPFLPSKPKKSQARKET